MKIQKTASLLVLLSLALTMLAVPAAAHGTYMSLEPNGVKIQAWYQGNEPMANCDYQVYAISVINGTESESLYMTGKTDENGTAVFDIKPGVNIYRVKVVSGEHAAERRIDLAEGSMGAAGDHGISWFNVFAGLGYIVGIAGILMYVMSRKTNQKK
ncbi:hypothetical protein [Methanolapillus millepedarum]|uniref:Nickel transport protein n=1 Tax=Methanolapillus millepedarum TaxID=3028296 RepID=A0AA97A319_9EURY|nr:hypothetical protein MsAc7_01300 [Methanosarcinaceae archaeon Ac7]